MSSCERQHSCKQSVKEAKNWWYCYKNPDSENCSLYMYTKVLYWVITTSFDCEGEPFTQVTGIADEGGTDGIGQIREDTQHCRETGRATYGFWGYHYSEKDLSDCHDDPYNGEE